MHTWQPGTAIEKELPILFNFSKGIPTGGLSCFQKLRYHDRNHLITDLTDIVEKLIKAKHVSCKRGETRFSQVAYILEANGIIGCNKQPLSSEYIAKIVRNYKKSHHHAE